MYHQILKTVTRRKSISRALRAFHKQLVLKRSTQDLIIDCFPRISRKQKRRKLNRERMFVQGIKSTMIAFNQEIQNIIGWI